MARRGRYTEVRKREILAQWERSQLATVEFVRRHGEPSEQTMMAWARELRSRAFLPVKVQTTASAPADGRVRLSLGAVQLDFDAAIEPDWLVAVVKGLQ